MAGSFARRLSRPNSRCNSALGFAPGTPTTSLPTPFLPAIHSQVAMEASVPESVLEIDETPECDACAQCDDTCTAPSCRTCEWKRKGIEARDAGATTDKTYTLCQVKRHGGTDDCWVATADAVFDATAFVRSNKHPGGNGKIVQRAGSDASAAFNHHSVVARRYDICMTAVNNDCGVDSGRRCR